MTELFMIIVMLVISSFVNSDKQKQNIILLNHPDIFLIGAMKAATTSFHALVVESSNGLVCGYGEKEKHFFNGGEYKNNYKYHVANYNNEFKGCKANQLTMDSTPGYAVSKNVLPRIQESYSKTDLQKKKIIFILREPVARHYSEYQMYVRLCEDLENDLSKDLYWTNTKTRIDRWREACDRVADDSNWAKGMVFTQKNIVKPKIMTFSKWIRTPGAIAELHRGRYYDTLQDWLTIFRRDQIYVINFSFLLTNTTMLLQNFYSFLDTDIHVTGKEKLPVPNPDKSPKTVFDCNSVNLLYNYFQNANRNLSKILNSDKKNSLEFPFGSFDDPRKKCIKTAVDDNSDNDNFLI
jgi:hypothetical protein